MQLNMKNQITALIKKILRSINIEIRRYDEISTQNAQLAKALEFFEIDLVIDVGANTGQFAQEIRQRGYTGNIISFEPLSDAHEKLVKASKSDAKWQIYERTAIGNTCGSISINISANSASSSILPMRKECVAAAPTAAYIGAETSPITTLDKAFFHSGNEYKNIFIKIDTQGYEWQVLDGAPQLLSRAKGVLLELSLAPLYDGQFMMQDVSNRMTSGGFSLWAINPVFMERSTGRTLQVDGTFFRTR